MKNKVVNILNNYECINGLWQEKIGKLKQKETPMIKSSVELTEKQKEEVQ